MIDIHSHILPGVDDGVRTLSDALEMLRIAAADGVREQVLTPHLHPGRFDNSPAALRAQFDQFTEAVQAAGIDIALHLAAEVHVGSEITGLVERDELPWLGEYQGRKTFLLEFPLTAVPSGSINLIRWLLARDVLPVIVHPERCREWQRQPDRLAPYLKLGCPLQITASSLNGRFGSGARAAAMTLLDSGAFVVIASDCHNLAYRPPDLSSALPCATARCGAERAEWMVTTGPGELLGLPATA